MMTRTWLLFFGCLVLFVSCAQKPTAVKERSRVQATKDSTVEITADTVLLDAREAFQYAVSHVPGSVLVRYEDFNQKEAPYRGVLELNKEALVKRLALYGVHPDKPVVIIGEGLGGKAREYRLQWMLAHFGVKKTKVVYFEHLRANMQAFQAEPQKNEKIWAVKVDKSLVVDREDFLSQAMKAETLRRVKIIDARTESEYLGKSSLSGRFDIGAMNVPWFNFYDDQGSVRPEMKETLLQLGFSLDQDIYVISNQGVRSSAVVMALRQLGFQKAANMSGGYLQLSLERN